MMLSNGTQETLDDFIKKEDPYAELKTKILICARTHQIENCNGIQITELYEFVKNCSLKELDEKLIAAIQKYPETYEDRFKLSHTNIDSIN